MNSRLHTVKVSAPADDGADQALLSPLDHLLVFALQLRLVFVGTINVRLQLEQRGFEDQLLSFQLVVDVVPLVRSVEEFFLVRYDVHLRLRLVEDVVAPVLLY